MSPCDCVIGGRLCTEPAVRETRVGLPGSGAIVVRLCRKHQGVGDDQLVLLAKVKTDTRSTPTGITSARIESGRLVQSKSTLAFGIIRSVTPRGATVAFGNGFLLACSKDFLKSDYLFPITPKHSTP